MSRFRVSTRKRVTERIQAIIGGNGWPARIARAVGAPASVVTAHHRILPGRWAPGAPSLRIAFASDFHAGPTTHPSLWAEACEALEHARPDVLLLGGDFVALEAHHADALAERLGRITASLGRYAVLGNHDYYAGPYHVAERLKAAGIQMLTNRNVRLPEPQGHVWICGIDDWGYGEPDADAALSGAEGIRIVLMHNPSSLMDLGEARFDVALCGHVHGGQIALPGGRAIVVPHGPLSRRYSRGLFRTNGGTLIVSRGIGAVGLPFRAFSTPEVVICDMGRREA